MTVCQICGDKGYVQLLIHCVKCRNIAVHRYCVLNPFFSEEETINWSCEFCDPCTTEPPAKKSDGLTSTVEQAAVPKSDRKKPKNNSIPPQSKKPNVPQNETAKEAEATDLSILDQKNADESVKNKQVKQKETGNPVLPHVLDATEKTGNSSNDVNGSEQELPQREGLTSTVVRVAVPKPDRKKPKNNSSSPQSKKPNVTMKDTDEKASDLSILDQKSKDGCVKSKQVERKENRSPVLPHVSDATGVVTTDIEKGDKCNIDVDGCEQELPQSEDLTSTEVVAIDIANSDNSHNNGVDGCQQELSPGGKLPRQLKRPADPKKGKKNKDPISDNGFKNGRPDADRVKDQKLKNLNSSDATSPQQPKLQRNSSSQKLTEGVTSLSILDQGSAALPPASETTEIVPATDIEKGDDAREQGGKYPRRLKRSAAAKEKKINDSISDIGVKTRSSDAVQVKKQKMKNVDSSDRIGDQQLKRANNLGSLKLKDCSSLKKTDHIDERGSGANKSNKSSSEVYSDQLEELPTNKTQPRDAELNDNDNTKKTGVEETVKLAIVQSNRDVSESKAPRKKRKVVIEMEYSDEDPVFVLSKHPQFVANVWKDSLSNSCSEAISKLSDDGLAQLSSIESLPHQSSPVNVDNRLRIRESSVVFENDIPSQPAPLNMVTYVPAAPLIDVAWRGYCNVAGDIPSMSLVLEAHLSNKAHEKVQGAVSVLPELLDFVFVPKMYAWPKTYERSPPTADGIGLYFFPVDERVEKSYFYLVDKMASCDLVLKSVINNLELLIFGSVELPREEWRFRRRYYLWGVFRPRKDLIMPNIPSNLYHIDNVQVPNFSSTHFHQETVEQSVGHRHDPDFSDHAEQNHDRKERSDRRDRRSRMWKGRVRNNSGRFQKGYRINDSVVII